jgi:predicted transglutaminase-like protease
MQANTFDAQPHEYRTAGKVVPSVTQILKSVMGHSYFATDWHMERGRIVHQCAAMLCNGVKFTHDPQIDGYVQSVKTWLEIRKPEIMHVEHRMYSDSYAGTCDLICKIQGKLFVVDWKASPSPVDQWQLAAYSALAVDIPINNGLVVALSNDGKPKEGKVIDLKRARNEWQSILNVYKMKEREKLNNE